MDRKRYAMIAQSLCPIGNRRSFEEELSGDVAFNAMAREIGLLGFQRFDECRFALGLDDIWVALRMSGDTDPFNAMRLEQAGLEELDRGVIDTERLRSASAEDESLSDFATIGKGGEPVLEIRTVAHEAGGHMGNRLKSRGTDG